MDSPGVYELINTTTGRKYIGSCKRVMSRKHDHLRCLRLNKHDNKKLQEEFNNYGETSFSFNILVYGEVEEIREIEKRFILKSKKTYNKYVPTGDVPCRDRKTNIFRHTKTRRMEIKNGQIAKFLEMSPAMWSMFIAGRRGISHKTAITIKEKLGLDTRFTMEYPRDQVVLAIQAHCVGKV